MALCYLEGTSRFWVTRWNSWNTKSGQLSTRGEYCELVQRSFDWYNGELAWHVTQVYNDRHIALLIETHWIPSGYTTYNVLTLLNIGKLLPVLSL